MKKIANSFLFLIFFPLLSVLVYFFIAYIFTLFPQKRGEYYLKDSKEIHILYNEMHSDIVFNIQDLNISNFPHFENKKTGYLAFGWGDKETYLNTPNIANLKISTSLKALFMNTSALMHVSYMPNIDYFKNLKTIKLSLEQHQHLKVSILKSFNFRGKIYKGYEREDIFYTANASYNLINTCNTWSGDRLRELNISMPYWTPFSWSVVNAIP
ncbi:MAG: Unknown protein [uncultured Sulfurovum sp.]|uniref:TIGR02117 family protein n=1 Tax=uncultured Sulfurovum sp. TaxID=269237 RepID=A0A6S6S9B6_9BACT|nr:MAG: Unknown protein [uncultured Sulfurovum sp.]